MHHTIEEIKTMSGRKVLCAAIRRPAEQDHGNQRLVGFVEAWGIGPKKEAELQAKYGSHIRTYCVASQANRDKSTFAVYVPV